MPVRDPARLLRQLNPYCARALEAAASLAQTRAHTDITPVHWLIKLLEPGDGDLPILLRSYDFDMDTLWEGLLAALDRLPHGLRGKPGLSSTLSEWLEEAWMLASLQAGGGPIRSLHLLQALRGAPHLLPVPDAWPLLTLAPVQIEARRAQLDEISCESSTAQLDSDAADYTPAESSAPAAATGAGTAPSSPRAAERGDGVLGRFTTDLTQKARDGQLDPVFCRETEIRQMVDILARRRKNNPILVGEPGVGKTALVEGLALKIVAGEVPSSLQPVQLRVLDLGLLQAGAGVKGEFEQRLKQVIEAVQASTVPILLFIDEAHTLVGAGNSAGGADAANLLKPALARGELRTIAATTWSEYKQYFERDAALERRFQPVKVDEPDDAGACLMLRGLQQRYASHHGVHVRDDAVVAAVQLSRRYISGRQLPDKAVDLLDTAAARVKVSLDAPPAAIEQLRARQAGLATEIAALQADIARGVPQLDARLADLQQQAETCEQALAAQTAAHASQLELVLTLQGEELAAEQREALRSQLAEAWQQHGALVYPEVDATAIAQVVADWTGIPLASLRKDEQTGLLELESHLGARVIGQSEAIAQLAASLRSARTGLNTSDGPTGVFLLTGPSGVGKTETAHALAEALFGGERALITINLSEYQEAHTVSQLKGSPPGYVGYGQGGVLTEAVRQHPYSIVLLDEAEKAHRDVLNLFYQVFDRGFMRDGEGREIDFRNTVIMMTSNLGADALLELHEAEQVPSYAEMDAAVRPQLVAHFQAALFARFQTLLFRPLDAAGLLSILELKLAKVAKRLATHYGAELVCEPAVRDQLVAACSAPDAGARSLDHLLNRQLLPAVSQALLQWQAQHAGSPATVRLYWQEESLQVEVA
ncbi:type VI secretion system ATPase TssH [Vogesella amnigena]|uniref:Type VI secretion system ATPase TssH n=1 Tax=Vogesella amnigena TaxID=1507449 RepID=A0ABV7TR60_9NEIS